MRKKRLKLISVWLLKKIATGFCLLSLVLFLLTSILFFGKERWGETEEYCSWEPERRIQYVYWILDYSPRKFSCWLYTPLTEKEKPKAETPTKYSIYADIYLQRLLEGVYR